jgi:DNA mismatch repair protein MSH4
VQIMAQIGSFVPAAHASCPIVRQIFARTSTDDSLEENAGAFALEMREMAFILRGVDVRSLAVVDELGRGTSSRDGLAIALAMSEALMASGAFVWFATHFADLARILEARAGVLSLHMSVSMPADDPSSMTMLYRVAEGAAPNRNYGVALARVFPFPDDVLRVATEACGALADSAARRRKGSAAVRTVKRRRLLLSLVEQLGQAAAGALEGEPLREWLEELQMEFAARMMAVDEEAEG